MVPISEGEGEQGMAEHRAGAEEGLDQAVLVGEMGMACDEIGDALVDEGDVGFDAPAPCLEDTPDGRVTHLLELIGEADLVVAELAAGDHELGELLGDRIGAQRPAGHLGGVAGDHLCVDPVVFGQAAEGAGVVAQLVRVDVPDRQPGLVKSLGDAALVAAARFQADGLHLAALQAPDQFRPALPIVVDPEALARLKHRDVEPCFGDVDADHHCILCHLLIPSLRSGGLPLATVRVQEEDGRAPAPPRSRSLRGHGLTAVAADRAIVPRSAAPTTMPDSKHTRGRPQIPKRLNLG